MDLVNSISNLAKVYRELENLNHNPGTLETVTIELDGITADFWQALEDTFQVVGMDLRQEIKFQEQHDLNNILKRLGDGE